MEITEQEAIDAINRGIEVLTEALKEDQDEELRLWTEEQIKESETKIRKIKRNSHYQIHIAELVKSQYIEESIILTVTYFEFLMRDLVEDSKSIWFFIPLLNFSKLPQRKKIEIRKKIKKYLDESKLYEQYLINIHLYRDLSNVEIEALYHTLFDSEHQNSRIKFQNLAQVKKLIKFLYEIDFLHYFGNNKAESQKKWKLLERLIKERHDIVHNGYPATLTPNEIIEILNSITFVQSTISDKLLRFGFNELKKVHNMRMEEIYKKDPSLKNKIKAAKFFEQKS
jgi:hypothetical protein